MSARRRGRGVNSAAVADGAQRRRMARLQNGGDGLRDRVTRERSDDGGAWLCTPYRVGVRGSVVAGTMAVSS